MANLKHKKIYPKDKSEKISASSDSDNTRDKQSITAFTKEVDKMLKQDPSLGKKAALIIEQMINERPKDKKKSA